MTNNKQDSTSKKLIELLTIIALLCTIIGFCYALVPKLRNLLPLSVWLSILGILILYLTVSVPYRIISEKRSSKKQEQKQKQDEEISAQKRKEYLNHIKEKNEAMPDRDSSYFDDIP